MNQWPAVRDEFCAWLRRFPLMTSIGQPAGDVLPDDGPYYQDTGFWATRTHEVERIARRHLADAEIDRIFREVAGVIDEDLGRFDPLVAYYGRYFPDGDDDREEDEMEAAHAVKRDLAWAAVERAIEEPGFFSSLVPWYDRGRWPVGWEGKFPAGHLLVV